jgi:hypothetical protein
MKEEGTTESRIFPFQKNQFNKVATENDTRTIDTMLIKSRTQAVASSSTPCDPTSLIMWTGTWNVSAMDHPKDVDQKVRDMVEIDQREGCHVDIYVVGLQEVTSPLLASFDVTTAHNALFWEDALDRYFLNPTKNMKKLKVGHIGGTMIAIYVESSCYRYISEVYVTDIPLGVLNCTKNKGAIGVRFRIHADTICVVCAHLTAGEGGAKCKDRIRCCNRIQEDMKFSTSMMYTNRKLKMGDHSKIIFMGDLNFRITRNSGLEAIKHADDNDKPLSYEVMSDILKRLRRFDELLHSMAFKCVLKGFMEGQLTFRPTYKYTPTGDTYDSITKRMPAWTDRILWKGDNIDLCSYDTKNIRGSDHKPLHAIFSMKYIFPVADFLVK